MQWAQLENKVLSVQDYSDSVSQGHVFEKVQKNILEALEKYKVLLLRSDHTW